MAKNSNKFVVDLGNIELDDSSRRKISALIQSAVLQHFAANTEVPLSRVRLTDSGNGIQGMIVAPDDDGAAGAPPPAAAKTRKR